MQTSAQKIMLKTDNSIAHVLNRSCGCARYAYNWARERWLEKKKAGQESVTCAELRKEFNAEKLDWMYESPKGSMDQAIKNFCQAKKRHYENPKQFGFPKRKKYTSKRSFYIENDKARIIDERSIKLPMIKTPVKLAESVCRECLDGKINNYTISRESNGEWYVSISYTYDETEIHNKLTGNGIAGYDLGVKTLITKNDGTTYLNAKIFRKHAKALKRYQRRMSRRRKGSSKYKRVKKLFNKKNSYVANYRKDAIHKATTEMVRDNMVIAIEDLNVKGMKSNHRLASAIADCGFGMIRRFLEYKCRKLGTLLLIVNRWFASSKTCSGCGGRKADLSLSEREYVCEDCGLVIDRDVNAAINILAEALFCELKIRFNTDVARRKFTPADLVALATALSGCGETTEETPQLCGTDAQCIRTSDGRAALVDGFFDRLRNHVANATVNCYV